MPNIPKLDPSILSQPIEGGPTLNDLAGTQPLTLDQIAPTKSADSGFVPPPIPSDGEANNYASSVSALSGDPESMIQTYTDVYHEMKTGGVSPKADQILSDVYSQYDQDNYKAAADIISDPNIPDEMKNKVIDHMYKSFGSKPDPTSIVREKSAAEYEPRDSDEVVHHMDILDNLQKYADEDAKVMEMYNREMLESRDKPFGTFKDGLKSLAYMIVPGMQGATVAKVRGAVDPNADNYVSTLQSLVQPGDTTGRLLNYVKGLPVDKQLEIHKKMFETLHSSGLNLVTNDNSLATMTLARQIITDGYSDAEKLTDNIMGLFDVLGVVTTVAKLPSTVAKMSELSSKAAQAVTNMRIRGFVDKRSLGGVYETTNPDKLRAAANTALNDTSGEAAKALFGTTREELAAHYHLPTVSDGEYIEGITSLSDPTLTAATYKTFEAQARASVFGASDSEIRSALDNHMKQLEEANPDRVVARIAESSITSREDGSFGFHVVYGKSTGGWESEEEALKSVQESLRHLGVPQQEPITTDRIYTINGKDPRDISFSRRSDGVVTRKIHYKDDGAVIEEFFVTDKNGDELWVSRDSYNKGEYYPVKVQDDSLVYTIQNGLDGVGYISPKPPGFTVNAREANFYRPISPSKKGSVKTNKTLKPVGKKTTYTVTVDSDYVFSHADVTNWDEFSVKRYQNFGMVGEQNSIPRHVFSPQTQFDQTVAGGASNAVNRAAQVERVMTSMFKTFTDKVTKLPHIQQMQVLEEINKARLAKKRMSVIDLRNRGLSDDQIDALNQFGKVQERFWQIGNRDKIDTARAKGQKVVTNSDGSTFIIGKPVKEKNPVTSQNVKVFDAESGQVVTMKAEDIKASYARGGSLVEMEHGIVVNGKAADYVHVNGSDTFIRDIANHDKLHNYIEGYSPTSYKDPIFIVKKYIDEDGVHQPRYDRTISSVGDSSTASKALRKLQSEHPGEQFYHRYAKDLKEHDIEKLSTDGMLGRHSSQRHRGQNLTTVDDRYDLTVKPASVLNPVDATLESIRTMSRRVGIRPVLENMKTKFLNEFSDVINSEDRFGRKRYPGSVKQIYDRGVDTPNPKKVQQAQAAYHHINSIEHGISNFIDERLTGWMVEMGKKFGGKAFELEGVNDKLSSRYGWLENKFLDASKHMKPLETNRMLSFVSYLGLNPQRQFFIQGWQATQLLCVYHPRTWNKIPAGSMFLSLRHMGLTDYNSSVFKSFLKKFKMTPAEAEKFYREFVDSGLVASIERHNMVGGSIKQLTEASMVEPSAVKMIAGPVRAAARYGKMVGFDAGEFVAKSAAFAAEYADKAYKKGWKHNFSSREFDAMFNMADNMTLNMNEAGELVYNKNALSLLMQFQQAPHKALLMLAHNQLTREQKTGLVVGNLLMYGVPASLGGAYVRSYFGNKDQQFLSDASRGIVDLAWNRMLGFMAASMDLFTDRPEDFGKDMTGPGLDFQGNLIPYESNVIKMWGEVLTSGAIAFQNSPSLSLWVGANPRIGKMIEDVLLYTGLFDDPLSTTPDGTVLFRDFMDLTSGTSNLTKTWLLGSTGRKTDNQGRVLLEDPTKLQMLGQFLGINTHAEDDIYDSKSLFLSDIKDHKKDIETIVKNMYSKLSRSDISRDEAAITLKALGIMREYCKTDLSCYNEFNKQMRNHITPDYVATALRNSGIVPEAHITGAMRAQVANGTDEEKQKMEEMIRGVINANQDPLIESNEGEPMNKGNK